MADTTSNSDTTSTTHPEDVGASMNSTSTTHKNTSTNTKCKRKTRGDTMYTKVKKAHEKCIHYLVRVDVATNKAYGEHAEDFTGYVTLQGRSKMSILLDSWHDFDNDLKENLWTDITIFILNFMICFTSMYDHLNFSLIIIKVILCKHRRCLLLVKMILR